MVNISAISHLSASPNQPELLVMLREMAKAARQAYHRLASQSDATRSRGIERAAEAINRRTLAILEANQRDMAAAEQRGLSGAMLDRLMLDRDRLKNLVHGMKQVATLPDPLADRGESWERPNGLTIRRVPVPLGVIGMVYESRPNVGPDAAALALKSGNALILRGGSESAHTSRALIEALREGLAEATLPVDSVQMVPTQDRAAVGLMLGMVGEIDVMIPRGGKSLTTRVMQESRVPTLLHLDGNCHLYVHKEAEIDMALDLVVNAKMRRTGICGALESLLVDRDIAPMFLPMLADELTEMECELRGDSEACNLELRIKPATEEDWSTEYLAPILSIKLVSGVEEAIAHINHYGSHHTDGIITADEAAARSFLRGVDSAIVMHNASTQFADGGEFGFGGEIGIATGRLHARGPIGAAQLTTFKYVIEGHGQVRP
jgi:glutamate-5-semialdehyde dehydrogenase